MIRVPLIFGLRGWGSRDDLDSGDRGRAQERDHLFLGVGHPAALNGDLFLGDDSPAKQGEDAANHITKTAGRETIPPYPPGRA
jgi:hypothetical protein